MRTALVAALGEVRKGLLISWTYRVNALTGFLTVGLIFIAIGFFMGGGRLEPQRMASTLLGYLTWMYALFAIGDLSWGLRGEINAGTLEQMSMSPAPIGVVLLGRVLANLIISTVQILLLALVMSQLIGIQIPMRWEGIPVLALTLVGVLGFGFAIAGAVLVFKQVESFANLVQNALGFLNGTFLPVDALPGWLSALTKTLPTTQGIIVLRRVVLEGRSLASVWQDKSLLWLAMHSLLYCALGWIVFSYSERTAKRQGTLGQY